MQLPAEEPALKVFARIQGSASFSQPGSGWEKVLAEEADGYAVRVLWVEAVWIRGEKNPPLIYAENAR